MKQKRLQAALPINCEPTTRVMRTVIILIALSVSSTDVILAQEKTFNLPCWLPVTATNSVSNYVDAPESTPTLRIHAEDIEQDSIQSVRFSTNSFAVRFTYTEAGAKKMLAFREAHEGQKVRTVVGSFQSLPGETMFRPMPPVFTNYAQWKEGWLKRRTDKFFGVSENEAKKIVDGLKKE